MCKIVYKMKIAKMIDENVWQKYVMQMCCKTYNENGYSNKYIKNTKIGDENM